MTFRPAAASAALLVASLGLLEAPRANGRGPRFYPDDPLVRVSDTQDASGVQPRSVNLVYDEARNLFGNPGDPDSRRPALDVNTIDEVPDSSWFTNRIGGSQPFGPEDVARGPDTGTGPASGAWTIIAGKLDGVTPGFSIRDSADDRWFIKFAAPTWPEMASGAEVVATKLFHALGYHVPENHVAFVARDRLVLDTRSMVEGIGGRKQRLTSRELDRILRGSARTRDGFYRVLASKALPGTPLGPFLYEGTRPDDPNDVVPHEHRRELRAIRVFAAWTNHVDTKSINSLDTLVRDGDRHLVRHHLIDFGSTLGSASTKPREYDEGHRYIFETGATMRGVLSLGFYIPAFHFIDYPSWRSVGHFSAEGFDPPAWKPRVPNPAFRRARPDDTFWGARRVMAFTDEMVRAAVRQGRYSDPAAERYVADTLIARRNAIGRAWLTNVNPIVDPRLDATGVLRFTNAAVEADVARSPRGYEVRWWHFDNATGDTTPAGPPTRTTGGQVAAPQPLPDTAGAFVQVEIAAIEPPIEAWTRPVRAIFRRDVSAWTLVGFDRLPEPHRP